MKVSAGLPNGAALIPPLVSPADPPLTPLAVERDVTWTPACGQASEGGGWKGE